MSGAVSADPREPLELTRRHALVELIAVCGYAITQPVLAIFGDAPDLFVLREATTVHILAFALAVAIGPALVLWSLELTWVCAGCWWGWSWPCSSCSSSESTGAMSWSTA